MATPLYGLTRDARRETRTKDARQKTRDIAKIFGHVLSIPKLFVLLLFIFLRFHKKIFSMTTSFRMTSFAPRKAITTATAAGAVPAHSSFSFCSQPRPSLTIGPAARHSCVICVFCGLIFSDFRVFRG